MQSIESTICEAIDIIVNKAIKDSSRTDTILAQIISCVDATIGKYKIKYQDNICYAYAGSPEIKYIAGTDVYVLVPSGNLDKEKTIIGTTKKLGINYVSVVDGDEAYEYIGSNCITSNESFQLSSYKPETIILYDKSNGSNNKITLDINSVNEYIKGSSTLICGARFRTALEAEQRFQGNYGIIYGMDFKDNATGEMITKYYIIDVSQMIGNPYKYVNEVRQYGIFDIDGANFDSVSSISIFAKDFPLTKEVIEDKDYDIFIRDIELYSAERLKDSDLNSYSLSILTPQGTFFDNLSTPEEVRRLEAQVKVKGKVVDNNSQSLDFYWFVENNGINQSSPYYCKHGGLGWKCLNDYNILKGNNDEPDVVEWIPGSPLREVKKSDIIAKEVKYKCVVVYDGTSISKTVIIKNLSSTIDISIVSDGGTQFYYDIGHPTLTCLVQGKEEPGYTYSWAVEDNNGSFSVLEETTDLNDEYNNAAARLEELQAQIKDAGMETAAQTQELEELRQYLTNAKKYCRIEKNKIHNLQINSITNFSAYKCSVYNQGVFLGTASIIITNSLNAEGAYSLVINDGTQVFKYNENGVSPASGAVEDPITLKALTFTVYNNLGEPIDNDVIEHCDIKWTVPTTDTMLKIPSQYENYIENNIEETRSYLDLMSFAYTIDDRYDINADRNNIQLAVNYKGMNLITTTNFTFIKEGESGTNGTDYVCKIVPNTHDSVLYPLITGTEINYTPINSKKWFRAQLWENGTKIYEGTNDVAEFAVSWSILQNKYKGTIQDASNLSVVGDEFTCSGYNTDVPTADIVKVEIEYNKNVYYATLPVPIVKMSNNDYRLEWKHNTGFKFATYTSDGQRPKYNDAYPFEITVKKLMNGVWEDVSLSTEEKLQYDWRELGRTYNTHTGEWIEADLLKLTGQADQINQQKVKPQDPYDGWCVNNAVECIVSKDGAEIGRIHIPIHLMLNHYGFSHLNAWDGNSIQIDNEQGFILSPQVGAGIKEEDNSFTGVLIGKVDDANEGSEAIGLLGYSKGQRSIFLDAETGKAEFGTSARGKIIIDPTENTAKIESGNYETSNGKEGMMIDFTTPQILFGTGNFEVNADGHITAKGGGSIAGWQIADKELYQGKVGMSSDNSSDSNIAFWAGKSSSGKASAPFRVDFDGNVYSNQLTAEGGTVGGWTISSSTLSAKNIVIDSNGSIRHTGGEWSIKSDGSASFTDAYIEGEITASDISGSKITGTEISGGSITGTTISNGGSFSVSAGGAVTASSITITGGSITIGSNFSVDSSGNLKATNADLSGKITATSGSIGGITINTGGGISGSGWSITSSGGISCSQITIGGRTMKEKWIDMPSCLTDVEVKTIVTAANFLPERTTITDADGSSVRVCTGGSVSVSLQTTVTKTKSQGGINSGFWCLGAA